MCDQHRSTCLKAAVSKRALLAGLLFLRTTDSAPRGNTSPTCHETGRPSPHSQAGTSHTTPSPTAQCALLAEKDLTRSTTTCRRRKPTSWCCHAVESSSPIVHGTPGGVPCAVETEHIVRYLAVHAAGFRKYLGGLGRCIRRQVFKARHARCASAIPSTTHRLPREIIQCVY